MIAFQPKFTKFRKTCYSEKLQYFQGKASYKGTTKLGRGFGGRVDRNMKGGYSILLFWHIGGGGEGGEGGGGGVGRVNGQFGQMVECSFKN